MFLTIVPSSFEFHKKEQNGRSMYTEQRAHKKQKTPM
jgi:hypothetical protein